MSQRKLTYFLTPAPAKVPRIEPENHDSEKQKMILVMLVALKLERKNLYFKCLGKPNIQEKYPCDNMGTLWNIIHKFHKDTFPNMLKLAAFTLNLPVHTADCERAFSLQNNIKNSQRNRLLSDRLDTLMVISAEGPAKEEFKFDQALLKWSKEKNRMIFSKA